MKLTSLNISPPVSTKNTHSWNEVIQSITLDGDTFLEERIQDYFKTGSRVICDPAPAGTDQDWCVLVSPKYYTEAGRYLEECGYTRSIGNKDYSIKALSYKWDDINIILIRDSVTFNTWKTATEIAKQLNLTEKKDRQFLFKKLIDLNEDTYEFPMEW